MGQRRQKNIAVCQIVRIYVELAFDISTEGGNIQGRASANVFFLAINNSLLHLYGFISGYSLLYRFITSELWRIWREGTTP